MPPKGTTAAKAAIPRLPPLPQLRVRRPNQTNANPCVGVMTSVLSTSIPAPTEGMKVAGKVGAFANAIAACWASSGYSVQGCSALETALRACMDTPVSSTCRDTSDMGMEWKANVCDSRGRRTSRRTPLTTIYRECIRRLLDRGRGSDLEARWGGAGGGSMYNNVELDLQDDRRCSKTGARRIGRQCV